MKTYQVESILWEDHSETNSLTRGGGGFEIPREWTVGFVIHEDKKQVVLCASVDPEALEKLPPGMIQELVSISILKSCIVKRAKVGKCRSLK